MVGTADDHAQHHQPFSFTCPRCERPTLPMVEPPERCPDCGAFYLLTQADRAFLKNRAQRLFHERLLRRIGALPE